MSHIRTLRRSLAVLSTLATFVLVPVATSSGEPTVDNNTNASVAWSYGLLGQGQTIVAIGDGLDRSHPWFAGSVTQEECFTVSLTAALYRVHAACPPVPGGTAFRERASGLGASMPQQVPGVVVKGYGAGHSASGAAVGASSRFYGIPEGPRGIAPDAQIVSINARSMAEAEPNLVDSAEMAAARGLLDALRFTLSNLDMLHPAVVTLNTGFRVSTVDPDARACDMSASTAGYPVRDIIETIDSFRQRGVPVVAPAGDDMVSPLFPACLGSVISVGAARKESPTYGSSTEVPAGYPRWNSTDVFASGFDVTTPALGGELRQATGSAIASSIVAGAIALHRQRFPFDSVDQVEQQLFNTGARVAYRRGRRKFLQIESFLQLKDQRRGDYAGCVRPTILISADGRISGLAHLVCNPNEVGKPKVDRIAVTLEGENGVHEAADIEAFPSTTTDGFQTRVLGPRTPWVTAAGGGAYLVCGLVFRNGAPLDADKPNCLEYEHASP